jgi:hypothetical protein
LSGSIIKRLIASCPCLLDLTLEANNKLQKVSILDKRLQWFALWCCHSIKSVDIDASDTTSRYKIWGISKCPKFKPKCH